MHSPSGADGLNLAAIPGVKSLRPIMTITLKRSTRRRSHWRLRLGIWLRGPTLARDIALVLAIKFALLMMLKYTFFNHPRAEHMSLPPEQVTQALLSPSAAQPSQGDPYARQ